MSVFKFQIFAAITWVGFSIILFDEGTGTAHQKQLHKFLPVLLTFTSFESLDASDEVLVLFVEFPLATQLSDIGFGANAQVGIIIKEQTQLVAQVLIMFVVGCGRQQQDFAILLLYEVFDVLVADTLIVAQVMAFINND